MNQVKGVEVSVNEVRCESAGVGVNKQFKTRLVYNSQVHPANIEAALAFSNRKRATKFDNGEKFKTRIITPTPPSCKNVNDLKHANDISVQCVRSNGKSENVSQIETKTQNDGVAEVPSEVCQGSSCIHPPRVNELTTNVSPTIEEHDKDLCLLYDCQFTGFEDKFVNSIFHGNSRKRYLGVSDNCHVFQLWKQ